MSKVLVFQISIISLILGIILGSLAPIPVIGLGMLLTMILLSAPIVILFLVMAGKLDLTSPKDSIITGGLIGFCANISFSFIYSFIMYIMSQGFHSTTNFFLSAMIVNSPVWLILIFILFLGVLSATTNAFSGFVTYYIINLIRDIYESKHPELKGQQDYNSEDYR